MSKWPIKKLDKHIIESKEQYGSEKLNGIQVLSVTNDQGFVFSDKRTSENVSNYKIIKNGYFAYNPYRINVGSLAFAGDEYSGIVSPAYVVFSCAKDLDPEYLWKYLKSDVGLFHIRQGGKGSVRSSLSFERLQEIEIPLPPLPEQKRIVKKIKDLESKLFLLRKEIDIRSGYLNRMLYSYLHKIYIENGFNGAQNNYLHYFCNIYQPKTIPKSELLSDGEYAVYGANGIIGHFNKYNHTKSEVLLTCRGATCGTINMSKPFSWINGNAMVVAPKNDSIDKEFLFHYLFSLNLKSLIKGSAQPQLTQNMLRDIKISVPPRERQEKIVKGILLFKSKVNILLKEQLKTTEYALGIMPSVLSKAFNGEL